MSRTLRTLFERVHVVQITDLSGGLNFVLLGILSFVWGGSETGYTTRKIVATVIVVASRFELGGFLFYRSVPLCLSVDRVVLKGAKSMLIVSM